MIPFIVPGVQPQMRPLIRKALADVPDGREGQCLAVRHDMIFPLHFFMYNQPSDAHCRLRTVWIEL